jgi:Ca-activated chloride channel family protein
MRFESPWALLVLLAVPLMLWLRRRLREGSVRFSTTANASRAGRSVRQRLLWLPTGLRVAALVLFAIALARPQEGREQVKEASKGVAILMAVDRSSSMQAEMDVDGTRRTRLDVVKDVFQDFVLGDGDDLEGRPNDLIGMVVFARFADTVCPLTLGHGALARFLESVHIVRVESEDGTSIGDGLALAAARLKTAEEALAREGEADYEIKSKVVILLTDGRHNRGKRRPAEAAKMAKEWGVKVYTIGVGGPDDTVVVQDFFGPRRVPAGSDVDSATLEAIARETGGIFRLARDADALRAVYQEIDALEKTEIESTRFLDYRELFWPFALAGLLLLVVEILLSCTVFRRIP